MIQDARGWYTGMTQRDGMGKEVGGGFRMGNTCTPMADSSQCMAKPIQCCKVKQINNFKKKERKKVLGIKAKPNSEYTFSLPKMSLQPLLNPTLNLPFSSLGLLLPDPIKV